MTEKEIRQNLSTAIDAVYSAMNPEAQFQSEESKKLRESTYKCIRKLEFIHDEFHKVKLSTR